MEPWGITTLLAIRVYYWKTDKWDCKIGYVRRTFVKNTSISDTTDILSSAVTPGVGIHFEIHIQY